MFRWPQSEDDSQKFLPRLISVSAWPSLNCPGCAITIAGLSCRVCGKASQACGMSASNKYDKDSERSLWSQSCFLENKEGDSSDGNCSDLLGDTELRPWYPHSQRTRAQRSTHSCFHYMWKPKVLSHSQPWTAGKWEVKNQLALPLDVSRGFQPCSFGLNCVAFQAHEFC